MCYETVLRHQYGGRTKSPAPAKIQKVPGQGAALNLGRGLSESWPGQDFWCDLRVAYEIPQCLVSCKPIMEITRGYSKTEKRFQPTQQSAHLAEEIPLKRRRYLHKLAPPSICCTSWNLFQSVNSSFQIGSVVSVRQPLSFSISATCSLPSP